MTDALPGHLLIGKNAETGEKVYLTPDMRKTHLHTLGRTGTGKTYFLEGMIRRDILAGRGVCVIDMLGNLYPRLLSFCAFHGLQDRTLLFDPAESDFDFLPGLNYLERFQGEDVGVVSTMAMMGIERVFREEESDVKPLWQRYGPATFKPLSHGRFSVTEAEFFADPRCKAFRKNVLATYPVSDLGVFRNWDALEGLRRDEAAKLTMVVVNRGGFFSSTATMRRICGQTTSTINWPKAMDDGKIVLVNLGSASNRTTEQMSQALGIILVHQILSAGKRRRRRADGRAPRPFYVYADEFGEVVCNDFAKGLDTLRQFNVRFVLANQRLNQLRTALNDDDLLDAVMTNTGTKVVFNSGSRDTEEMAQEIYLEEISGDGIKHQGYHTFFEPILKKVELHGHVSGSGGGDVRTDPGMTFSESSVFSGADNELTSTTKAHSRALPSNSQTSSYNDSDSMQEGYVTEHKERREPQTPVYTTPEEQLWKARRAIGTQPPRRAKFRHVYSSHAISIITPEVEDMYPTPESILRFKEFVYTKNGYLTSSEIDRKIDDRLRNALGADYARLMEASGHCSQSPPLDEEPRWE